MGRGRKKRMREFQVRYGVQIPRKIFDWLERLNLPSKTEFTISDWVDRFIKDSLHDTPMPAKKDALKLKNTNETHLIYLSKANDGLLRLVAFHTNFTEEEIILNVLFDLYCLNNIQDNDYERSILVSEFNGVRKR